MPPSPPPLPTFTIKIYMEIFIFCPKEKTYTGSQILLKTWFLTKWFPYKKTDHFNGFVVPLIKGDILKF